MWITLNIYKIGINSILARSSSDNSFQQEIKDGDTVCVSSLAEFSLEATVDGTVGSVRLNLHGPVT